MFEQSMGTIFVYCITSSHYDFLIYVENREETKIFINKFLNII